MPRPADSGYDALQRLISAKHGALDSGNTAVGASTLVPTPRLTDWAMDILGNWTGKWVGDPGTGVYFYGREVQGVPNGGGTPLTVKTTHDVDATNQLRSVVTDDGLGGAPTSQPLIHDVAGNLIADANYFYQYDGWGRLVQVNARGTLGFTGGQITGTAGPWIAHYTYDGLGRLFRKQSPLPVLDLYGREQVRTERYFFDGVRRVQELFTDPLAADDGDPVDISDEGGGELPPLSTTVYTSREHIYSPGYVDEWVAQVDVTTTTDRPAWVLQDANYNVLALVDSQSRVLRQYTYDPYGELLAMDRYDLSGGLPAPFENRVGHQGLFFDRLDAGVLQTQMAVGVNGLYQNRNRTYSPGLGRFVQKDPNVSGLQMVVSAIFHGVKNVCNLKGIDASSLFRDGANLYQYEHSSPNINQDPMGLFTQRDGYAVEAAVQNLYLRDHPGHRVVFGNRPTPLLGIVLKPDIINFTKMTWLEVKPLSPSGIVKAAAQGAAYLAALGPFGITPDIGWTPSTHTLFANGRMFEIMNFAGIIHYTDFDDTVEDLVVTGVGVLAYNAEKMFKSGAGKLVLQSLLRAGGGSGLLAGVGAAEGANLEMNSAIATQTGAMGGF